MTDLATRCMEYARRLNYPHRRKWKQVIQTSRHPGGLTRHRHCK